MTTRAPDDPRLSPVMLRKDLVADGWTDVAIARQVRGGAWVRARRGAYVARSAWDSLSRVGRHEVVARAVLAQGKTELVLSHLSALPLHDVGTWDIALGDVDVTRRDARAGRREAGVRQHRGILRDGDVVERHGVPVVSATRLALEVTTCLDVERALVVVDQLLHRGLTTPQLLEQRYATMDHWPHTLLTDLVLRRADGRHESIGETRFAHLCHQQRLPRLVPQHEVRDARGELVARLDFALPAYRAWIEFDGGQKYDDLLPAGSTAREVVMAEKRRESRVSELLGWICIRVTWEDLADPLRTAARIRRALEGRRAA